MKKTPVKKNKINKNSGVMKLLSCVPEFQSDVLKIRKEFHISDNGFKWRKSDMFEWAKKNNIWYYEGHEDDNPEEDSRPHKNEKEIRDSFPSNLFEERMLDIGVKYNLPYNFYAFPYSGIAKYILSNELEAPSLNYGIDFKFNGNILLFIALAVYAPLSKKEATEATEYLIEMQSKFLPQFFKDAYTFGEKNVRNNLLRDINLYSKQQNRLEKPKKITTYKEHSYVSILSKSKDFSDKRKRTVQRKSKANTIVKFSEPTSKDIGKIEGVSGEVARQSKTRLNSLAKELFGYGLEL